MKCQVAIAAESTSPEMEDAFDVSVEKDGWRCANAVTSIRRYPYPNEEFGPNAVQFAKHKKGLVV